MVGRFILIFLLSFVTVARAEDAPTTQPVTQPASVTPIPGLGGAIVDRLENALAGVDLSADQRKKVDQLTADFRKQLADVATLPPEDRRDTIRQVTTDTRQKLGQILTPQQQVALRDRMQMRATSEPPPKTSLAKPEPTQPPSDVSNEMKPAGAKPAQDVKTPDAKPDRRPNLARVPTPPPPQPAAPVAPADPNASSVQRAMPGSVAPTFSLDRLGTGVVKSASFANRVVVIEFGSYTTPSFRYRSAAMDALAKQYGQACEFVIVYTAEAHPAGDWDVTRNKQDGVSIAKHATMDDRVKAAEMMKAALRPTDRTIAIDDMSDSTAKVYNAGPHTAFVIGRDGVIVARQQWCDPDGLKRHIDEAVSKKIDKN